jgi:hypothetical protein
VERLADGRSAHRPRASDMTDRFVCTVVGASGACGEATVTIAIR